MQSKKAISVRQICYHGAMLAGGCFYFWRFARDNREAFYGAVVAFILTMLMVCLVLAIANCNNNGTGIK